MKYELTAIEEQKKDPDRCSVFINGEFGFGLSKKAVERYNLRAGMTLDETAYQRLVECIQLDKAKFRALDSISRGSKSEKQMREKLIQAEYSAYIVEEVISFLKKYNYINDEELAKRYVDSKSQYSHKSLRQIKAELYKKGVIVDQIKDYCEDSDEREEENIQYFLDKFKYDDTLDFKQKQKIINRLLTRGFSYSQVERCLRRRNEGFDA